MLTTWTRKIIDERIETLRQDQQEILHYHLGRLEKKDTRIALKTFGFDTLEDYDEALANALEALRGALAEIGLNGVTALDFDQPNRTWEGKIAQKVAQ